MGWPAGIALVAALTAGAGAQAPSQASNTVRIELSPFGALPLVPIFVGCMFLLDL